jgi:iron(III) transport system permease protein
VTIGIDQASGATMRSSILGSLGLDRSLLIQWSIFAITIVIVALPIAPIIYQSLIDRPIYDAGQLFTLQNYVDLFAYPELPGVVRNSFLFAFLTTIFAQTFGAVFAILIGRTDLPGRQVLGSMLLWPLFLSQLVLGFGWFMTYGPAGFVTLYMKGFLGFEPWSVFSIAGMAVIAGISQTPLALLYCLGSVALSDASLEDAARSSGAGPIRTLTGVTLPLLMPAILYGAVLNFTISLEMLSIPLIFGEPAGIGFFTTLLYTQGITSSSPKYGLVGTAAVLLLAIVTVLVYLQGRLLRDNRRFVTVGGKAARPKPFRLGALKWPAFAFVSIYILLFVILPVGVLGLRGGVRFLTPLVPFWNLFTLDYYLEILTVDSTRRAIFNTLVIATLAATLGTGLSAMIAIISRRSNFPYRGALEYFALFPRALPGIVAGIGFFYAVVFFPPLNWLQNTIWVLIIAYAMRYIPTGFGAIAPALMQVGPDLDRSARVMGADWWTSIHAVILKLLKPSLFTCFALLFIHFSKEYSTAIFLFGPGSEVIGTRLLQYWVQGELGQVAALSMVQILVTVIFIFAARRLFGVKIYG